MLNILIIRLFYFFIMIKSAKEFSVKTSGGIMTEQDISESRKVNELVSGTDILEDMLKKYLPLFDIFKIKQNEELIGYVEVERTTFDKFACPKFFSLRKREDLPIVGFYSFWVKEECRKKGLGRMLLESSLRFIKKSFYPNEDFIVAISLEKKSPFFNDIFEFYYKLGLTKGLYINYKQGRAKISSFKNIKDARTNLKPKNFMEKKEYFLMCDKFSNFIFRTEEISFKNECLDVSN